MTDPAASSFIGNPKRSTQSGKEHEATSKGRRTDKSAVYARIREAVAWREREAKYSFHLFLASCQTFAAKLRGKRPHGLPAPLVVSLTSYPPRFPTLALTLKCLLRQTVLADCTVLWVTKSDYSHLPSNVVDLRRCGLQIRTAPDTHSYMKVLPALAEFPHSYICTANDDLFYWPTWLEELVQSVEPDPKVVLCHRVHEITLNERGMPKPYCEWNHCSKLHGPSELLFLTGCGGVLYPPGILAHSPEDERNAFRCCAKADDVWLYWMCRRNGARFKLVGTGRELLSWRGSQTAALQYENVQQGGNDRQIAQMCSLYGFPPALRVSRHVQKHDVA